jgi:parallel beta-helix repeat protein
MSEEHGVSADEHRIGDYVVLESLGQGPGAVAYRALDPGDGREVVVRQSTGDVLAPDHLHLEIEILSGLRHPNIVRLIDSGESEGQPYCVLARAEGVTLDALPAAWRAAIGQSTLRELLGPLADALGQLHEAGYLHGDVSPRNILLRRDGRPLLLDFGAAEPIDPDPELPPAFISTPGFAAPERGEAGRQGPWTDLYALAAVAHWLITGSAPAERADGAGPLSLAAAGDRRFSPSFLQVIDQALAPDQSDRPASAADWRQALFAAAAPERPEAPSLGQLAGALREEEEVDLPAADEVPPTVLLRPETRMALSLHAAGGSGGAAERAGAGAAPRKKGRHGWLAGLVLLLAAVALGAGGWWGWGWYQTYTKRLWVVDPAGGGDVATIGEAVARAAAGSTIRIAPGLYVESLTIERPLILEGSAEWLEPPVISPAEGPCILLRAPWGTLTGLAFRGGDGGSVCLEVAGGEVAIQGVALGPWQGTGIRAFAGAEVLVLGNSLTDIDGTAIAIEDGAQGRVEDNVIERSAKSAIAVRGGGAPAVQANRIVQAGQAGLLIDEGARGLYADNEIVEAGASGIEVRGGAVPQVARNRIEAPGQSGIFIHGGASGDYLDNRVTGAKLSGVVIGGGAQPVLTGNEIGGGEQHGVLAVGASGGRIEGNRIFDNAGYGLVLGAGTTAELDGNELNGNRKPQLRRLGE